MKKNIVISILLIIIILMGGTFYYLYTNQDKIFDKCKGESKDNKEQKTQISFDVNNKTIIQALHGDLYTI